MQLPDLSMQWRQALHAGAPLRSHLVDGVSAEEGAWRGRDGSQVIRCQAKEGSSHSAVHVPLAETRRADERSRAE